MAILKTVGAASVALALIFFILKCLRVKKRYSVKDKVVLITGASSGLGEACANVFYKHGAKVILCARRIQELQRVKNELISKQLQVPNTNEAVIVQLDLSNLESIPQLVSHITSTHGAIDILINNGGISYRGKVCDTSTDVDQRLMLVNYLGQVAVTKAVLPSMLTRKSGNIVAISSVQGKLSIPFRAAYSASKHALQAFCDCLRAELSSSNIRVTVVSPGYINTNLSINAVTHDGNKYGVVDSTTASGMRAEDCAQRVLDCVEQGRDELILAPLHYKLAIYIRALCPQLFFWLMKKRAKKQSLAISKVE